MRAAARIAVAVIASGLGPACIYDVGAIPRPTPVDGAQDAAPDGPASESPAVDAIDAREAAGDSPVDTPIDVSLDTPGVEPPPVDADPCDDDAPAARVNGEACACDSQCGSGVCTEGVCCDKPCAGHCESCLAPGKHGACSPIPNGLPSRGVCFDMGVDTCGFDGRCDGMGGCRKYPAGTQASATGCSGPATYEVGLCDGVGGMAMGTMMCAPYACQETGGVGACATTCDATTLCALPAVCMSGSCGKAPLGAACKSFVECASGECSDGVCCSAECGGACQSCTQPGDVGNCRSTPADSPDPHGVCVDEGIASCGARGICNGKGDCQRYPDGFKCASGKVCKGGSCG